MFKKMVKNQKGLTLIELLVVVVILGIIAAIAIPSVGGLIGNARKDAHVGNAQQMVNSTRLYITSTSDTPAYVTLDTLLDGNYIEPVDHPENGESYHLTNSRVTITNSGSDIEYRVTLEDDSGNVIIDDELSRNLDRESVR
ncbi:type IV pilus assembly protein PilA [Natronobacillus azotifigens]|uniref:type II secretion system protein n=1 Tax=Natronobacillus azotifigens TaxID=472978 RepID=UPI002342E695|nr:prepilin-type N-terminal cleavage/methylation domain-containing protein [Natronobacillus azotifigens]